MQKALLLICSFAFGGAAWAQSTGIDRAGFNSGGVIHLRLNGALGEVFVFDLKNDKVGIQSGKVWSSLKEMNDTISKYQTYSLYPNPTHNVLNVQLPQSYHKGLRILVFDLQGKKHLTHRLTKGVNTFQVDVSHLAKGTYLLSVEGDKKWLFETIQFVKQ